MRNADVSYTYTANQRKTMTDGLGLTTWSYDDLGRALAITDPFGNTVGYGYDGQNNRTRLTYADEKVVQYAYDSLNRLLTVTDWNNRATGYTYDAAGRTQAVTVPNGVTTTYAFDDAGGLSSLAHHRGTTLLANYQYSYDLTGNRLQAVEDVRQLVLSAGTGTPPGWTPPAQFAVEEAGYLAMTLAWPDAAIEEDSYTLERSTDGQQWIAVAELSANMLRYVDYGLARHTRYGYRLTANNSQGGDSPQTVQAVAAAEPVSIGEDKEANSF